MSLTPPRPVVAIRVFAFDATGRILLLRRANSEYGEGQWCLPGGKLDYGDSPEGTVSKELGEETSLNAKDVSFLFYQNSLPTAAGKMHCLNLYFRCTAVGNVTLNEESSSSAWLSLTEALERKPVFGAEEAIRRLPGPGDVTVRRTPEGETMEAQDVGVDPRDPQGADRCLRCGGAPLQSLQGGPRARAASCLSRFVPRRTGAGARQERLQLCREGGAPLG